MKNLNYYMHKDCLDCCIKIKDLRYNLSTNSYSMIAEWWNLGYTGKPWIVYEKSLRIFKINARNWIDITDKIYIPRIRSGVPHANN